MMGTGEIGIIFFYNEKTIAVLSLGDCILMQFYVY